MPQTPLTPANPTRRQTRARLLRVQDCANGWIRGGEASAALTLGLRPAAATAGAPYERNSVQRSRTPQVPSWTRLLRRPAPVAARRFENGLRVELALDCCFEPGECRVLAPLAAVLDLLARTQFGKATRFAFMAPVERVVTTPALDLARVARLRRYLIERGIAHSRIFAPSFCPDPRLRILVLA